MRQRLQTSLGWVLAGSILLSGQTFSWAQVAGIAIRQPAQSNDISVTIDPALVPNAQIKRHQDAMVIVVPEGLKNTGFSRQRLLIDAAAQDKVDIQSADLSPVQLQATDSVQGANKQTVITIRSANIRLNVAKPTEEIAQTPPVPPPATQHQVALAKTETTLPAATPKTAPTSAAPQPVKPTTPEPKIKENPATNPTPNAPPIEAQNTPETAPPPSIELPTIQPPNNSGSTPLSEGEAGIPLEEVLHSQVPPITSDGTIPRMLISLIVVLGILIAALRVGLPRLLERFPELAKKLEALGNGPRPGGSNPPPPRKPRPTGLMEKLKQGLTQTAPAGAEDESFGILKTLTLAPGRTLHLVQVNDRQLVVGATEQNISLLAEYPMPGSAAEAGTPPLQAFEHVLKDAESHQKTGSSAYIEPSTPQEKPFERLSKLFCTPPGHGGRPSGKNSRSAPTSKQAAANTEDASLEDIVEAESVEILEDYDDHYKA
jgi:flagellar biogenesis protein FliO